MAIPSGTQPFQGDHVAEVLAAVAKSEPTLDALPAKTPPEIRNLVRRCLEKNPRKSRERLAWVAALAAMTLVAVALGIGFALNGQRLELTGEAFPIAEQIQTSASLPNGVFSASENDVLAYQTGTATGETSLVWFDRTGKQIGVLGAPAAYGDVELSPDGKRASVSISDQAGKGRDIWLFDLVRNLRTRFTSDPGTELASIWSSDGGRIVFNSNRKGHLDLYQKATDGIGTEEALFEDNTDKYPVSWSPDGRFILYRRASPWMGNELFALPLFGDRRPILGVDTPFSVNAGQFSADGRWIAHRSDETGKPEIYIAGFAPFSGPGVKWEISNGGGDWPRWRRDSTEIFYLAPDNKLMAAAVNGKGGVFQIGTPKQLFQTRAVRGQRYPYAVSADGQRFLINSLR